MIAIYIFLYIGIKGKEFAADLKNVTTRKMVISYHFTQEILVSNTCMFISDIPIQCTGLVIYPTILKAKSNSFR